jgi:hypothetical protein
MTTVECAYCREQIKTGAIICRHCRMRQSRSRADIVAEAIGERIRAAVGSPAPSGPVSPCDAFCVARFGSDPRGLSECRNTCREAAAVAATAERLHRELVVAMLDAALEGGDLDPIRFERLVRARFAAQSGDALDPAAIERIVVSFLAKVGWGDDEERRRFVRENLDTLVAPTDPAAAAHAGLPPLTNADLAAIAAGVDAATLNREQIFRIRSEIESRMRLRDLRGVAGAIWAWLCTATGGHCSSDSSGGSVGGPRG